MKIRLYNSTDRKVWDSYVLNHPNATHCHLSGWKRVMENAYGHRGYYPLAEENSNILGIRFLFQIKSFIFGINLLPRLYGLSDDRGDIAEYWFGKSQFKRTEERCREWFAGLSGRRYMENGELRGDVSPSWLAW